MKVCFMFLFLMGMLSCTNKDENPENPELIGKWRLIEILADPGDGSGKFQKVNSRKIIELHSDEKITSNGSIYYMSVEVDSPSAGTYSLSDSTIISPDCSNYLRNIRFKIEKSFLIISYPCDEACLEKYKKE